MWAHSYLSRTTRITPWPADCSFDTWWQTARRDFNNARATSFYRYLLPAFRDLYGIDFDTNTVNDALAVSLSVLQIEFKLGLFSPFEVIHPHAVALPVDVRFGPRGALYVCDWYNPVKGHAQYSLRDERRDRHLGRIWRITAKGHAMQQPPKIDGAPIADLLDILKRPEYRYRYWAKRELRERPHEEVQLALEEWIGKLRRSDPRYRHHQMEALWMYRNIGAVNKQLLRNVLKSDNRHARAAATRLLRYWHEQLPDAIALLRRCAALACPRRYRSTQRQKAACRRLRVPARSRPTAR